MNGFPVLLISCFGVLLISGSLAAHDRITTKVTWDREIAPIVRARCVTCHSPGGRAPMPLTTYEEARPWAKAIKEEVLARRMPKWHVVRGYGDFKNDPSLSAFEIALVAAWADGGAPAFAKASASAKASADKTADDGGHDANQGSTDASSAFVLCGADIARWSTPGTPAIGRKGPVTPAHAGTRRWHGRTAALGSRFRSGFCRDLLASQSRPGLQAGRAVRAEAPSLPARHCPARTSNGKVNTRPCR